MVTRSCHIPSSTMIPQGWSVYTPSALCCSKIQLRTAIQGMPNQPPIDQICARIYGDARKVLECRCSDEIVLANSTDTGIRVEPRQNGVAEGHDGSFLSTVDQIFEYQIGSFGCRFGIISARGIGQDRKRPCAPEPPDSDQPLLVSRLGIDLRRNPLLGPSYSEVSADFVEF